MDFQFLNNYKDDFVADAFSRKSLTEILEKKLKKGKQLDLSDGEILIEARDINEAFEKAAKEFKIDVSRLYYKVIDDGRGGLFKKHVKVIFSIHEVRTSVFDEDVLEGIDIPVSDKAPVVKDGYAEIDVTRKGKFLMIYPPGAGGQPITEDKVKLILKEKNITDYDPDVLSVLVAKQDQKPFFLGEWTPNRKNDGKVFLEVSDDRMKAFVRIIPPKYDGRRVDEIDVEELLKHKNVTYGIKKEEIQKVINQKIVNKPQLIVEGKPCQQGKNAKIVYKVSLQKKRPGMESDGRVDYYDLNLIQNVMAEEVLAEKIPAETGEDGIDIYGERVEAVAGSDVELKGGENTEVTLDGKYLKSKINGHVVKEGELIAVKEVFVVNGDVGPETGNITHMGSVFIKGSVLDGFKVTAAGNIEVAQTVGKAVLEASNGDIVVKLGVNGKQEGRLSSETGSVKAKFFQNVNVYANQNVFAAENITQSRIMCHGSVRLDGKKAAIQGGHIRTLEEVEAKVIGASGGAKTVIEVGVDPEVREAYDKNEKIVSDLEPKTASMALDLKTLKQQAESDEKAQKLEELTEKYEETKKSLEEAKQKIIELEDEISSSEIQGKVIAHSKLYSGVTLKCNTGILENSRDQGPSYYVVDESKPEYVKFNKIQNKKGR